jgi:hypothetical protein
LTIKHQFQLSFCQNTILTTPTFYCSIILTPYQLITKQ